MSLNNFYKLRKNFILIGLTGKMQSGASEIADLLNQEKLHDSQKEFLSNFQEIYKGISSSEATKIRRINDFFQYDDNWVKFDVLDYRNVLLLFILHHNYDRDYNVFAKNISNWICNLGNYKDDFPEKERFTTPRFGGNVGIAKESSEFLNTEFKESLVKPISGLNITFKDETLFDFLKKNTDNFFFEEGFINFAKFFNKKLDTFSPFLRHKLMHVTAYCLRGFGTLNIDVIKKGTGALDHIYTIADVINRLIKIHRKASKGKDNVAHVIIDRLKNSYELMYFKEKYSGFYMISSNCNQTERKLRIKEKYEKQTFTTDKNENLKLISKLDEQEYKTKEFKNGIFDGFDVENCVQKADYHTYLDKKLDNKSIIEKYTEASKKIKTEELERTNEFYIYQPLSIQVLKLVALIQQPGLITPTYIERIMQIAHTAKLNSGCISRQVGAVVTDSSFSVKGIGWNDVPEGQTPCANRDLRDLINEDEDGFTQFELGDTDHTYKDGQSFNKKLKTDYNESSKDLTDNLQGRPCAFCFKTFHNKYEGKENQVHTRSLHAEENAMLQIAKNGGQGLKGGNLFTTASPCELCSKKAYQLGIKNIFYIDLYPGISEKHILQGGTRKTSNPNVYQFQGVIGRGYQKLYEPFMTIKDETTLRSRIKPTPTAENK